MASKAARIWFRCWYCNRGFTATADRVGAVMPCPCGHRVRVPRRSGGNSRHRSVLDWLVEGLVYGGAGAAMGFGLGWVLLTQFQLVRVPGLRGLLLPALSVAGFLAGLFGGEPAINWMGRTLRDRTER